MSGKYIRNTLPTLLTVDYLVSIMKFYYPAGESNGESHDFWEFIYVEEGNHTVVVGGKQYDLKAKQLLFYPPNYYHKGTSQGVYLCIASFSCHSEILYELCGRPITLSDKQQVFLDTLISEGAKLFNCLDEVRNEFVPCVNTSDFDLQILKNRLEIFLLDLYKSHYPIKDENNPEKDKNNVPLPNLIHILKSNITQKMSITDLSQISGVSVSIIKKLFHETYGCGPMHFFLDMKIEEAKKLLTVSNYNVTQTSEQLGFSSVHYFSRIFKEKTGVSPKKYMQDVCEVNLSDRDSYSKSK